MSNKRVYESELWYNHKMDYFTTIKTWLFAKIFLRHKKMLIVAILNRK